MNASVSRGGLTVRIGNAYIKGSGSVTVSRWKKHNSGPFIHPKPDVQAYVSGHVSVRSAKLLRLHRDGPAPVTLFFGQGRMLYGEAFVDTTIQGRHVDVTLVAAGTWKMRPEGD